MYEVDKEKDTFPVTGTMHVVYPADVSEEELKEIENVLAKAMANSLECTPEQIKVTIDPETGIATYVVKTNDPHAAEEMHKVLKSEDFCEKINQAIPENSEHLAERIREVLAVDNLNVNSLFQNNHNKTQKIQNSNFYFSKFVFNFQKTTKLGFQHSAI